MDDKCRCKGEPVAWLRSDELRKLGHPYSDAPLNSKTDSMMLHAKGTQEAAAKYGHDVPVFTTPQPHQIPDGLVPIFQIKLHSDTKSTWHDATQSAYDVTPTNMRRTLYTSPQPKQQVKGVNSTHTPSKPVKCVGCKGSPSSENSPCGVCGQGVPVGWEFCLNGDWIRTTEPETHKKMGREVRPLYTAPQPPQIPEGYKLVPIEPTIEQTFFGVAEWSISEDPEEEVRRIYKAMLEAAPSHD